MDGMCKCRYLKNSEKESQRPLTVNVTIHGDAATDGKNRFIIGIVSLDETFNYNYLIFFIFELSVETFCFMNNPSALGGLGPAVAPGRKDVTGIIGQTHQKKSFTNVKAFTKMGSA